MGSAKCCSPPFQAIWGLNYLNSGFYTNLKCENLHIFSNYARTRPRGPDVSGGWSNFFSKVYLDSPWVVTYMARPPKRLNNFAPKKKSYVGAPIGAPWLVTPLMGAPCSGAPLSGSLHLQGPPSKKGFFMWRPLLVRNPLSGDSLRGGPLQWRPPWVAIQIRARHVKFSGGEVGTRDSHPESDMSNFLEGGWSCKTLEGGPHTMAAKGPHKTKSVPGLACDVTSFQLCACYSLPVLVM
jgi:hypothetical protein